MDPEWATLRLASTILGGGGSSILFHDLRDRHGYVYSVYTSLASERTRSVFELNFASDPDKVNPAQSAALRDILAMQQMPTNPSELQFGKAELISSVPLQEGSYDGVTSLLLRYSSVGLPLDQNLIDARRQLGVTQATLRASVAKWIRPAAFVRVIEGPGPK
jgi:zinc protease